MITVYSCKTLKQTPTTNMDVDSTLDSGITEINHPTDTIAKLITADFKNLYEYNYQWLTYRAKVDYTIDGNIGTCNLFFVNRIDSIIYFNINISGIEIIRIVFTPNQITYVNKLNKTYYQGNYFLIEKIAKIPLNFHTIQSIFNGKEFVNYEQNFTISNLQDSIVLFSPKRKEITSGNSIKHKLVLNSFFQIIQNYIELESISKILDIKYLQYNALSEFPFFNSMTISSIDFKFSLDLKNIRFNTPGPTAITIPESFTKINFQPKF